MQKQHGFNKPAIWTVSLDLKKRKLEEGTSLWGKLNFIVIVALLWLPDCRFSMQVRGDLTLITYFSKL